MNSIERYNELTKELNAVKESIEREINQLQSQINDDITYENELRSTPDCSDRFEKVIGNEIQKVCKSLKVNRSRIHKLRNTIR